MISVVQTATNGHGSTRDGCRDTAMQAAQLCRRWALNQANVEGTPTYEGCKTNNSLGITEGSEFASLWGAV